MLAIVELVTKYDFEISPAKEDVHLLETYVQANLKHKGQVNVHFTPRQQENQDSFEKGISHGI